MGSNQSGSSQSSSFVNELKLEVTTNFGTEEYSSASELSFSDLERLSCDFLGTLVVVVANVSAVSLVGNIVCLTLYPSETATGQLCGRWRVTHIFVYTSISIPREQKGVTYTFIPTFMSFVWIRSGTGGLVICSVDKVEDFPLVPLTTCRFGIFNNKSTKTDS